MEEKYDVIIIGTGPNGLTAGAYLTKAGQKVLLLEKRYEVGGGLATEEVTIPGYLHNTHAMYHLMVDYAPPLKDLNIEEEYNVRFVHPNLQWVMPLSDGRCLCIYRDVDRTCQSIAQFSQRDADSYRQMHRRFRELTDSFLAPATYVPPMPVLTQAIQLQSTEVGKDILELSEQTPEEIVNDLFEHDIVRTLMLYVTCHWGLEYDVSGVSYLVPLLFDRATNYRLVVGGSHRLSNALLKANVTNGSKVKTSVRIKRIMVEDGVAKGVELEDGTQIGAAKAVLSTIDPIQTFIGLVGEAHLAPEFVEKTNGWDWEKWSLLGVHLALEEAPRFKAAESHPEINDAFIYVLGYESTDELKKHWDAIRNGELPDSAGIMSCFPSIHDPSQAPSGRATGHITQMAPYRLTAGAEQWLNIKFKEAQADRCLAILEKYAPNMTKDKVLWQYVSTPADIANKFSNMGEGSIKQGAYHTLQMGYFRPNDECSQNRTPIEKLYIGGASCYPGGLVTFGSGYLAANTIIEDAGIEKPWPEPEVVTAARQKGML